MKGNFSKCAKRASAIMLCASMALTVAGCSKNSANSDVVKVEVWSQDSHSKTVVNELVVDWNETKGKELGVEIVYTVKEGDIKQATDMAMISEQAPDLFSSVDVKKYAESGDIVSIEDLPGGKEMVERYDPLLLNDTAFKGPDGKIYCLPVNVITFGLVYNKDMFKKYGIVDENGEPTPPKTFDEVREYAKRMTNEEEHDYGIILPMKWSSFYSVDVGQLVWGSAGRKAFDCTSGTYDFSVFKPIYEMYIGLKEDNSIFPGAESLDNDMARAYFAERNIGMKLAGSYDVGVFNSQFPAKCDWGVAPNPVENEDERYKQYMVVGGHLGITRSAVEKVGAEKIMEVFKFFHSDEYIRRLYEEGMLLPYDSSIVEGITPKEGLKGWDAFVELADISTGGYSSASVEITGEDNEQAVFMNKVWNGSISVDEAIEELNERYNRGMEKYYSNNTSEKVEDRIIENWDIKLD